MSIIATPTVVQPTVQPTSAGTPTPHVVASVNEIEAKRVTISATGGGEVAQGDLEIEIPANALEQDSSVEIAKVTVTGRNSSDRDGEIIAYDISTGAKDEEVDLKEPAKVIFKNSDPNQRPALYNGDAWVPIDDYQYDPNTKEMSIWINYIEEDSNEYIQSGDEEGEVEAPIVIANLNKDMAYKYDFISSKNRFKVFYNNAEDKTYAESIAATLEEAYDYYAGLGYKPPVKSLVNNRESTSNYIYTYIYNDPDSRYNNAVGVAWTLGYMGFNKRILDIEQPRYKSTCYHELLHLTQYAYGGNRSRYDTWFSESMCTAMQYYAINRPAVMYDLSSGSRWNKDLLWYEIFNYDGTTSAQDYNKYIIWSYLVKQSDIKLFHDIMSTLPPKDHNNPELLNSAFQKKFGKNLPTLMNELIEDYYIYGKVFNKNYFSNLSSRSVNQPYADIIERDSAIPGTWSNNYSIQPLSMRYVCYNSTNFQGIFELDFSNISSNCKIKIFPMKNSNGTYELGTVEEVTADSTKRYTMGTNITNLFVLIENTSMNSNATVNFSTGKL